MRLEALCQMSSFLSKMEEKSSGFTVNPQFPALLQSVQLQFLSGCFGLGTQIIGANSGANYETQHYMVHLVIMLSHCLCTCKWLVTMKRNRGWIFKPAKCRKGIHILYTILIWHVNSTAVLFYLLSNSSHLSPVWYTCSLYGYTERATICSPHVLPAGGACPQTEGPVGKRTHRFNHYVVLHSFNIGQLLYLLWRFSLCICP